MLPLSTPCVDEWIKAARPLRLDFDSVVSFPASSWLTGKRPDFPPGDVLPPQVCSNNVTVTTLFPPSAFLNPRPIPPFGRVLYKNARRPYSS